jgi:hypothetical protein
VARKVIDAYFAQKKTPTPEAREVTIVEGIN